MRRGHIWSEQSGAHPASGVGRVDHVIDLELGGHVGGPPVVIGRRDQVVEECLAFGRIGLGLQLGPKPQPDRPSSPMPPSSPVGQATTNSGALKLPAAIAWAPSP